MKQTWKAGNMLYPVPAVMVSCARPGEKPNIVTVAWAGTICSDPAMVSISVRKERYSHDIIEETKEFVINLTTKKLVRATDYCGVRSGRDVDKFKELHLTPEESEKIKAPGIAESPVNIECKVKQVMRLGSHDMFIAEVVAVRVDESLLDKKGTLQLSKAELMAYSHGSYYELGKSLGKFGFSVQKKNGNGIGQTKVIKNKDYGVKKSPAKKNEVGTRKQGEGRTAAEDSKKTFYKEDRKISPVNKNASRRNKKYSGDIRSKKY